MKYLEQILQKKKKLYIIFGVQEILSLAIIVIVFTYIYSLLRTKWNYINQRVIKKLKYIGGTHSNSKKQRQRDMVVSDQNKKF